MQSVNANKIGQGPAHEQKSRSNESRLESEPRNSDLQHAKHCENRQDLLQAEENKSDTVPAQVERAVEESSTKQADHHVDDDDDADADAGQAAMIEESKQKNPRENNRFHALQQERYAQLCESMQQVMRQRRSMNEASNESDSWHKFSQRPNANQGISHLQNEQIEIVKGSINNENHNELLVAKEYEKIKFSSDSLQPVA